MTIDERLEFLVRNAETHERQIHELYESVSKHDEQIKEMRVEMREGFRVLTANVNGLSAHVDMLATAMQGLADHALTHAKRLDRLEGEAR